MNTPIDTNSESYCGSVVDDLDKMGHMEEPAHGPSPSARVVETPRTYAAYNRIRDSVAFADQLQAMAAAACQLESELSELRGLLKRAERLMADTWQGTNSNSAGMVWLSDYHAHLDKKENPT